MGKIEREKVKGEEKGKEKIRKYEEKQFVTFFFNIRHEVGIEGSNGRQSLLYLTFVVSLYSIYCCLLVSPSAFHC